MQFINRPCFWSKAVLRPQPALHWINKSSYSFLIRILHSGTAKNIEIQFFTLFGGSPIPSWCLREREGGRGGTIHQSCHSLPVLGVTCYKVITLLFSVTSSVRHYCSECSTQITVCQARSSRSIASCTHHTQRAAMGGSIMEEWLVGVWHEVSFTITDWLVATCKGRWDNNGSINNSSGTCCCMQLAWSPPAA